MVVLINTSVGSKKKKIRLDRTIVSRRSQNKVSKTRVNVNTIIIETSRERERENCVFFFVSYAQIISTISRSVLVIFFFLLKTSFNGTAGASSYRPRPSLQCTFIQL